MKHWKLSTTVLAGALALVVPLSAGAAGSETFADPAGDAGAAPDVQRIVVSNTNAGLVRFAITYANRTVLEGDDGIYIAVDTDKNRGTGDPDGTEYLILVDVQSQSVGLGRWTGSTYDFAVPQTTLRADAGRNIEIDRSELGDVTAFDFFLGSFGRDGEDFAPDGADEVYAYELDLTPELRSLVATFTPKQPRAGRVFAVSGVRVQTDTAVVQPDRRTCTARLAGRTLRPIGPCRWRLPRSSVRRQLVVTIRVTYGGVTATAQPYRFRVRR